MISRTCFAMIAMTGVAVPTAAQQKWTLVEDLRIGGADLGSTSFSSIHDIAVDAKGQIFVLDDKEQEIRLFDANGKFIRLVGRKGAGPGEYSNPNGFRLAPDGKLWVNDHEHGRYVVFGPDGKYLTQVTALTTSYGYKWPAEFDSKGRLMESIATRSTNNSLASFTRRYDPMTAKWDTVASAHCNLDPLRDAKQSTYRFPTVDGGQALMTIPMLPRMVATAHPSGGMWCGSGIDYHIIFVPMGESIATTDIRRDYPPIEVADSTRNKIIADIRERAKLAAPGTIDFSLIPHTASRFIAMYHDDQDRLWAYRSGGERSTIDVWNRSGAQVATLLSPEHAFNLTVVIRGGKYYSVVVNDDGVPYLVRYAIKM